MSTVQLVTLIIAILGVLHGPGTQAILARFGKQTPKQ